MTLLLPTIRYHGSETTPPTRGVLLPLLKKKSFVNVHNFPGEGSLAVVVETGIEDGARANPRENWQKSTKPRDGCLGASLNCYPTEVGGQVALAPQGEPCS